jgi:hypothetical protein
LPKLHEGPAFVHHKPAALDSQRDALRISGRVPFSEQERPVDLPDMNSKLAASLKSRSCRKGRYAPPVHMIKLTETREITPYKWVHPDEER